MKTTFALLPLIFPLLAAFPSPAAEPVISEFMADNGRSLADEDGKFPDWIEIHNRDATPFNLAGYHLTDDPQRLNQWAFPSVELPPRGYLVVFASGENRTADPAHLHTSFPLNADGGFLALVKPDGSNIVSAFTYPAMKEDVSFGLAQGVVTASLLAHSAPRVLVPTNAVALPSDWRDPAFLPGVEWLTGAAPPSIGFDTNLAVGAPANVARSGAAQQSTVNGTFAASLAIDGNLGNFTHTLGTDTTPFWQVTLTNEMVIFEVVLFNRTSCCGSRLRDITVEIISTNTGARVTNYSSTLLNPENAGFAYPNGPSYLSNNLVTLTGGPVSGRIVLVRRTPDPDLSGSGNQGNADEGSVLSLGEVVINASAASGLKPYVTTDIQTNMMNVNASAFVRLAFTNDFPPTNLALNVRYDDGLIAHLNGVEIESAARHAPGGGAWNTAATADRNFASAITPESIDLSLAIPLLVPGQNVLAVQLLNHDAANGDALFQAELTATGPRFATNVFFGDATPGTANTTDWYYDEVRDTHFSVARGFFETPFSLAITSGTPDAVIYYSFNGDEPGPGKGFLYTGPIAITNTTVLRTRAFKENWKPTDVDTASYLFLGDVIYQAPNWEQTRLPPPNFPASWGANAVDYGMDPQVVTNYTPADWKEALTQIPSLSIVTEMKNLFDPTTGIYANASGHGEEWERPMSLELLDPAQPVPGQFQENGGLRIRGGFSRNPQFFKHSFRLFFNRTYGAGSLDYPLFGDEGASSFDKFDLRTSQNYSWPRNESSTFDTMVREVFCRKTLGDMGQPYRRSRYYHLYLNGQYWGLYETDERPSAYYGEAYFGGSKTNYDVVKCGNRSVTPEFATEATDGNFTAWSNLWVMCQMMRTNASNANFFRPLGRNPDGTRNPAFEVLLDVDNLIDYILEIFFSGDGDATLSAFLSNNRPNNWFGLRNRANPEVGFRFFNSDCEHTLGSPSSQVDRTGPFAGSNEGIFMWSNPQWMHEELARNLEYRVRFADHVQKHFFNGGALTFDACTNRFLAKSRQITKAIRAYSARWGDAIQTTQPLGERDWTNAINFCLNWLALRPPIVLQQLRIDQLHSSVGVPGFNHPGGAVSPGFNLEMAHTNATGAIYFTLDGTDPRRVGGAVSSAAQAFSLPVVINAPTLVRTRVLSGTNWSAIIEATYLPPQDFSGLRVTEIMYNPPGAGAVDGDEFEFLELKNAGLAPLDLSGLRFTAGITFTFTNGTMLAPGAFFVLARNPVQLAARSPGVTVSGTYAGRLDNAGETLTLSHPLGATLVSVSYDDLAPWPVTADGFGFSVVPVSPNSNPDPDQARNWRASSAGGGSPGTDDPPPGLPALLINEVLTASLVTDVDTIELFNPTMGDVNIGGWFLTDDPARPEKFRIPDGTMIAGSGYRSFTEADFNPVPATTNNFSFRAEGDEVYLFSADAATHLTGYSHGFALEAAESGVTFGRYVISTGAEHLPAQIARSPDQTNVGPRVGPVVLTEIMYHPPSGEDEFIEFKNITGGDVPLFDPDHSTNTWRLNGLGYQFPTNIVLGSNECLLLVATNPAAFRLRHAVPADVQILGPYTGTLQDSGERLELKKPGPVGTNGNFAYITVDAVRYNDRAPWPPAADGSGPSLQRKAPSAYADDPVNWTAATSTPGAALTTGEEPVVLGAPTNVTVLAGQPARFQVTATGAGPLFYQWLFQGDALTGETADTLILPSAQPSHAGSYSVLVYNATGSAESDFATLTVNQLPRILTPPQNRSVNPSNNASFSVFAVGTGPLRYQWFYDGSLLLHATNATLTLTNVQLPQAGAYAVTITDVIGSVASQPVSLIVLVRPTITLQPISQTVIEGGTATFTIAATGATPIGFRWRKAGVTTTNGIFIRTPTNSSLTITNARAADATGYTCVVTNFAGNAPTSSNALLTVLTDSDMDGIPDFLEPLDGAADSDNDTMSNAAEYFAGTDWLDRESYLKVNITSAGPATIWFNAVSNRTYSVQFTDSLNPVSWRKFLDVLARTNTRVETLTDPAPGPERHYRLVTPVQP